MPGSLRIGKIAGIDISIHVSWLIIVVLLNPRRVGANPAPYAGNYDLPVELINQERSAVVKEDRTSVRADGWGGGTGQGCD